MKQATKPQTSRWHRDSEQFVRLLAEINAMGLADTQRMHLCQEMDIHSNELDELFYRVEKAWEKLKEELA